MRRVTESHTISPDEIRTLAKGRFGDWLEFDSMINLRPSFGNRSRGVDDPVTRVAIAAFIARVVRR
jgi:hypothetical protein